MLLGGKTTSLEVEEGGAGFGLEQEVVEEQGEQEEQGSGLMEVVMSPPVLQVILVLKTFSLKLQLQNASKSVVT